MRGDWLWCRGSKGLAGQVNALVVSTAVGVATERAGFSNWNFWAEFDNEAFQLHGERGDAAFSTGAADAAGRFQGRTLPAHARGFFALAKARGAGGAWTGRAAPAARFHADTRVGAGPDAPPAYYEVAVLHGRKPPTRVEDDGKALDKFFEHTRSLPPKW